MLMPLIITSNQTENQSAVEDLNQSSNDFNMSPILIMQEIEISKNKNIKNSMYDEMSIRIFLRNECYC